MSFLDEIAKAKIKYAENQPLSRHSSFKIGGNCRIALFPETAGQLGTAIALCAQSDIKYTVIGNGSNVLFSDDGYDGAIVFTRRINDIRSDGSRVTVGCGVTLGELSDTMQKQGVSGFEFAYGIPGTVGGAVFMNAGAYGGEIANVTVSVDCIDAQTGKPFTLSREECGFSYRNSIFVKNTQYIIASAVFEGAFGDKDAIRSKMNEYMMSRKAKQPLEYPSAGSVFKRPEGYFAGRLIEDAGLKGYSVGGAQVSEKHAGFIINRGGATARDVLELIEIIKEKVFEKSGVTLECEIRTV